MDPQESSYYNAYFAFALPEGKAADASPGCVPDIRVWREPALSVEDCPDRCGEKAHRNICGYQRLVFYTVHQGLALNQVCW
jgi:hypothetical protein